MQTGRTLLWKVLFYMILAEISEFILSGGFADRKSDWSLRSLFLLPKVYLNLRKSVEIVKGDLQVCKFQVCAWGGFCVKAICYYTAGGTPWPPLPLCTIQVVQVWAMLLDPSIQLYLMFMVLVTSCPWIKFSCYVLDEGTMLSCSWQTWRRDCCSIRACTLKQGWWKAEQSWPLFCHKCKQDTAGPSSRPYPCPISTLMLDFSCMESGDFILEKAIKCPLQCKLWLLFRYRQCSFYRELYWNCLCTFSSLSVLLMVSWIQCSAHMS